MSVRPPTSFQAGSDSGFNVLEYELASERADALGRNGRKVERALADLAAWRADDPDAGDREVLLESASQAVWAFFIQREICGLRNTREVIARYGIPGEVLSRLGAVRK